MRRYIYILTLLALSLQLSGCGIYSKFQRSEDNDSELTSNLYSYVNSTSETESAATMPWRELFTDPQLQALIERGLESNTNLNVAHLSVEQAEISLSAARKAFAPSLGFDAQAGLSNSSGSSTSNYALSLASSWEIDLFGRLRNAKEQSRAALERSMAYHQLIQTQLIATIAGSYYTLLMLDEQLKISEQTKINWEENLRAMEALKRAGRINETAVLQSQASNVDLSSQIVTLRQQIAQLESSLSLLLALPVQSIPRGSLLNINLPMNLSLGLPIELLSNRPDVRMAESYLAEMFYATAEARSSLYPSISLSGSAGFTNASGISINPSNMIYNLVGSLLQPIFNRGALKARVKISESQQEQAVLQFQQSILDAGAEVNMALIELRSAEERLLYGAQQIDILSKTVSKSELLMKHGSSNTLEVLTAQLSLLKAELAFSTEMYNQAQGIINLYRALGGGER